MRKQLPGRCLFLLFALLFGCRALFAQGLNTDNTWTNNNRFKGPIPWADLSSFARPVSSVPSTTTSGMNPCTATLSTITLAGPSSFQNGDGITVDNCGTAMLATITPATPNGVNSLSAGGTGLGGGSYATITTVPTGLSQTTRYYKIVAIDKNRGVSLPSAAGLVSSSTNLGQQTCAISSGSRSGVLVTVNFSAACEAAVVGAKIHMVNDSNPDFDGYYNIKTVNSTTQIVLSTAISSTSNGWQPNDSNSSTGGNAVFFVSDHITWAAVTGASRYVICESDSGTAGTFLRMGMSQLSTSIYLDLAYDYYGSTFNGNQTFPPYITTASCNAGTPQNDALTTTIVSGAGTATITVANPAVSTSSAGYLAVFDDAPGLISAMAQQKFGTNASPGGPVYIPETPVNYSYVINSYVATPSSVVVLLLGSVTLNETWEWATNFSIIGNWANGGTTQFGWRGNAQINVGNANPGVYVSGTGVYASGVRIATSTTNGGVLMVHEGVQGFMDYMEFDTSNSSSDTLGMALVLRGSTPSSDSAIGIEHSNFHSGTTLTADTTWTPLVYVPAYQNGSGGLT